MKKLLKKLSAAFFAGVLAVATIPSGFSLAAQDASTLSDGTAYLNINKIMLL